MKDIKIVKVTSEEPCTFQDNFFGAVRLHPPTATALNRRGRRMWSIWTPNSSKAISYHRSEKAGLEAMRGVIDNYFN